jgi:hypothetical protein
MINPIDLWGFFLQMVERRFLAAHPLPTLPAPSAQPVVFAAGARNRHAVIYGLSGTGKSRLIEDLVMQQIDARLQGHSTHGLMVIDVHDELYFDLRARIALKALQYPALYDIFVPIDPLNERWCVRYDPLSLISRQLPIDRANVLSDVITTIFADDPSVVVRLQRVLRNTFETMIQLDLPFDHLFRFLGDKKYRSTAIELLAHIDGNLLRYWQDWFPQKDAEARSYLESTLNRLEPILRNPRIGRLIGTPTINFRSILDSGAIVLVNAPKGVLSQGTSQMLCGLLLAEVTQAAMSRGDLPKSQRRPFVLFCDEFASYITQSLLTVITETRKYGLELIAASQEVIGQEKNAPLQRKILKTVGTLLCFKLGSDDALTILGDLFTPTLDQVKYVRDVWQKPHGVDTLYQEPVFRGLDEIREKKRAELVNLPNRMFFVKQRGVSGTYRCQTRDMPDVEDLPDAHLLPEALARLDEEAARRFGFPVVPAAPVNALSLPESVDDERDVPYAIEPGDE